MEQMSSSLMVANCKAMLEILPTWITDIKPQHFEHNNMTTSNIATLNMNNYEHKHFEQQKRINHFQYITMTKLF